jgi:hypothetical protein
MRGANFLNNEQQACALNGQLLVHALWAETAAMTMQMQQDARRGM